MEDETDEEPNEDKGQDTPEEVCSTGLTKQAVGVVEDTRHQQDINHIFETEREC